MLPLRDTVQRSRFPIVNSILIAINVGIFLYEISLRQTALDRFFLHYALIPYNLHLTNPIQLLLHPFPVITLVTSMFLHSGWLHIISNMWVLFIFGDNVEDRMGSGRYLFFYLVSGVVANLLQAFVFPLSQIPTLGASGAIAGILGAYFLFYPTARVLTLIPIFIIPWLVELPAIFFLGFWFVTQLFSGVFSLNASSMGGVAWWAHIGGFLFGLIFAKLFAPPPPERIFTYPRFPDDDTPYFSQ